MVTSIQFNRGYRVTNPFFGNGPEVFEFSLPYWDKDGNPLLSPAQHGANFFNPTGFGAADTAQQFYNLPFALMLMYASMIWQDELPDFPHTKIPAVISVDAGVFTSFV